MTRTLAELQVSKSTHDEIKSRLLGADYGHLLLEDGLIDLEGIGLTAGPDRHPEIHRYEEMVEWLRRNFSAVGEEWDTRWARMEPAKNETPG
jgi:hypothetical protein